VRDHWHLHARRWALVGPPLRPCPDDVALVERAVATWRPDDAAARPPRALVLGSTPELVGMRWPPATRLVAVDRSAAMLGALVPPGAAETVAGEWTALPFPAAAFDLVAGDGITCCLPFPAGYRALAAELRRACAPGAVIVLRLFALPAEPESLADVAAALAARTVVSFHALKWRIAMAIQPADRNVAVADIARAFDAIVPDRAALPWPADVVGTIDHYRGSEVEYSFPTVREITSALVGLVAGPPVALGYELADRCPTLVFRIESD
jgi:SAM-dependent methyltransferase